jgi:hypothetical protein
MAIARRLEVDDHIEQARERHGDQADLHQQREVGQSAHVF